MPDNLADIVKDKFPGAYDHLDGDAIEQAIINKYPGAYDHLATPPADTQPKSTLDKAIDFISHIYSKDPSKESNVLPDIKQPTTWAGGFGKSLYDQYVKPFGTIPAMAEALGGMAAGGIHDVPSAPTMKPSDSMADVGRGSYGKPNLPEFAPTTEQGWKPPAPINIMDNPAVIHDPNYFRLSARDIYPSEINQRQGLMSETGSLGSGGPPKSEDYLQARQFFRDQGKEIPKGVQSKASDMKFDDDSGMFRATDSKGKTVGVFDDQGNPQLSVKESPKQPEPDFLTKAANTTGMFARNVLGLHVPGTAISVHGLNEVRRDLMFGGGPLSAAKRGLEDLQMLANPGKAQELLNNIPSDRMSDMINKGGVQMNIGDVDFPQLFKGSNLFTKGYNFLTDPKPLFNQVIPAMKAKTYGKYFDQLKNSGLEDDEAHKVAGNFVNNIFGGVTPEKLSADPTFRKMARIATIAPDWMTSNFRLGRGMLNTLKNPLDPRNRAYANGMMNFGAAYTGANLLNYATTGHLMFNNEPGKELSVAMGNDSEGKTRYFEPFGTAMDMVRLPIAIAHSAVSGDPGASFKMIADLGRDRLSPPVGLAADLMFNKNYKNQPLYGKSRFGHHTIDYGEEAGNIGKDILDKVMPSAVQAPIDYMQGESSPEEAIVKALTIPPISYRRPQ